ncbi:MAG: response regulator [Ardenticatenaceae bacterium]
MTSPIRVAIADDHQAIIDGYLYRLNDASDIKVVGVAFDGQELEALLAQHSAEVLILDVGLPTAPDNANPYPILHAIPQFIERYPSLSILVISMHTERTLINEVIKAGASGYILKDDRKTIRDLANVIRTVGKGDVYFSKRAFQKWQKRGVGKTEAAPTARQIEVLSLCAAHPELTTNEVAKRLSVRPSTVRNLLSEAYRRLGVNNRTSAIHKARQLGLITPHVSYAAPTH